MGLFVFFVCAVVVAFLIVMGHWTLTIVKGIKEGVRVGGWRAIVIPIAGVGILTVIIYALVDIFIL